jgi:dTDP-4-dehydrorhamnose 3,5-epimerase
LDGIILTPLKQIQNSKGDIFHAIKRSSDGYQGFGEAYFSTINKGDIKNWRKHKKLTSNIIVPVGEVKFVIYDEKVKEFFSVKLSLNSYQRLTVKPGFWFAFQGLAELNLLLNVANIEHDPNESVNKDLKEFKYEW